VDMEAVADADNEDAFPTDVPPLLGGKDLLGSMTWGFALCSSPQAVT